MGTETATSTARREIIYRHSVLVRVTHWVNALALLVLLMSGMQIFNAHPALYLGSKSDFEHPVLAMMALDNDDGGARGVTEVFGHSFNTTGVLGLSRGPNGDLDARGFPSWATLPGYQDLSTGRRWHFFCLAVRTERARLSRLEPRQQARPARLGTQRRRTQAYRQLGR